MGLIGVLGSCQGVAIESLWKSSRKFLRHCYRVARVIPWDCYGDANGDAIVFLGCFRKLLGCCYGVARVFRLFLACYFLVSRVLLGGF